PRPSSRGAAPGAGSRTGRGRWASRESQGRRTVRRIVYDTQYYSHAGRRYWLRFPPRGETCQIAANLTLRRHIPVRPVGGAVTETVNHVGQAATGRGDRQVGGAARLGINAHPTPLRL